MVRRETIRYKLLRSGIVYGELFPTESPPTLVMDRSGEIKMSMQGEFLAEALDTRNRPIQVDWVADEIMPVLTVDGMDHPLGILMPASITGARNSTAETVSVQAFDRCWRLRDTKVERTIYFPAETLYIDAIEELITAAGIPTIFKTASDAVMAEAREDWQAGTSYLSIVNQLLAEINYKQLWFNSDGAAVLEPKLIPTAQNIKHVFTDGKPDKRNKLETSLISIAPTVSRVNDLYSVPNVFICVCSNPDKSAGMTAMAENRNPESPLSISRRGRRIVSVVNVKNIASQSALQSYANNLLSESMMGGELISIETNLLPGFGVDDPVAISAKDVNGICVERSWTMQLQPGGRMTHELERVVINLD